MIGGVKYEHGHRMVAELTGLLTIIAAIWTWRVDSRRWMRMLTAGAVLGVVFQGILGGLTVLNFLPPAISSAHATVGQTMFCVLAAIALFTSRSWLAEPEARISVEDAAPLIRHCWMLAGFLYLQLILGAAFRHVWTKLGPMGANTWPAQKIIHSFMFPHILNALIVGGLIIYVGLRVITRHPNIPQLRKPGHALLILLVFQLLLGFTAFVSRMQGADESQPTGTLVATTVGHMGVGALILALTAVLTIQAYRHRQTVAAAPVETGTQAVTA